MHACGGIDGHARSKSVGAGLPCGTSRTPLSGYFGFVLSIVYGPFAVLLLTLGKTDIREFTGPQWLLHAIALIMAGILAEFLTNYFQPAQRSHTAR